MNEQRGDVAIAIVTLTGIVGLILGAIAWSLQ